MSVLNFRDGKVQDCFQVQRIMPIEVEGGDPHCACTYHVHAMETGEGHFVIWSDTQTVVVIDGQPSDMMKTELARIECETLEECEHHFKFFTIKAFTAAMEFNNKSFNEEMENEHSSATLN